MPPKHHAASRAVRKRLGDLTPITSSVLLMVRTGTCTGSQLVATLHTTLDSTLEDIRLQLVSIATAAKSGKEIVPAKLPPKSAPVNLSQEQVEAIMNARLHPFELAASFRFVRRGGGSTIPQNKEATIVLHNILPVAPPWGLPQGAAWAMTPAPATVILPRSQVVTQPATPSTPGTGLCEALVVIFVAQGEFGDEAHSEKVVMERLHMQTQSYGRQASPKQLASFLHKWNANVKDFMGRTLLQEHAIEGNAQVVKYLLSLAYVRVSDADNRGDTALHLAVWKGHLDIVSALLLAGANPLQQNNLGQTSLHVALLSCQDTIVDALCKRLQQQQVPREALAALKDNHGLSPLGIFHRLSPTALQLAGEGSVDALRALCSHYLYDRRRLAVPGKMQHELPLHEAALNGHLDVVNFLVDELRVPVDTALVLDCCKRTPLHHAARHGHTAVVKRLLQARMDPNALDNTGRTPLLLALHFGRFDTAEFLVENCPHQALDVMDKAGISALHIASAAGAARMIQLILDRNSALVDLRHVVSGSIRQHGQSGELRPSPKKDPLGFLRFVRLVNQRYGGRRCRRRSQKRALVTVPFQVVGPSPLWCAVHASAEGAVAVLLSRGAGRSADDTPLFLSSILQRLLDDSNTDCASAIVKLIGPAVTGACSVLNHFIETRNASVTRWLCDRRVGADAFSSRATSAPLCVAARVGDATTVKYLLSLGASAGCGTAEDSPLLLAIRAGHDSVVREIILAGYRPAGGGNENVSPIAVAARFGRENIVRGLVGIAPPSTFDAVVAIVAAIDSGLPTADVISSALLLHVNVMDSHIHPAELLHMFAAHGLWRSVECLILRLSILPPELRESVAASSPQLSSRPSELVTPTVPDRTRTAAQKATRGRKPLHPKAVPFIRFVPRTMSTTPIPSHKLKIRDVFSFAAQAMRLDLVEALLSSVGLAPSPAADLRGLNSADYALEARHYELFVLLVASNIVPQLKSKCRLLGSGKLKTLAQACRSRGVASSDQPPFVQVLCGLMVNEEIEVARDVLLARLRVAKSIPNKWLLLLLQRAVSRLQLKAVKLLIDEFLCDPSCLLDDNMPQLGMTVTIAIVSGCAISDSAIRVIHELAGRRCPMNSPSVIPPEVARAIKKRINLDIGKTKLEPAFVAATFPDHWAPRLVVELLHAARQGGLENRVTNGTHDPLLALILSAPHLPSRHIDEGRAAAVAALAISGHVYGNPSIARVAARKGLVAVCRELVLRYGGECFAADLKAVQAGPTALHYIAQHESFNELLDELLFEPPMFDELAGASDFPPSGPRVSLLLSKLPSVHWDAKTGTPCDDAIRRGNIDAAAMLVAANVFPLQMRGPRRYVGRSKYCEVLAFVRVVERWKQRGDPTYTMLHAAAELNSPQVLDRLLIAFSKSPQDLPIGRHRDSVLAVAARHADEECVRIVLRSPSSPLLRGLSTSSWMCHVLANHGSNGSSLWSVMLSEYRGGALDVTTPLPCWTISKGLPHLRDRLRLPLCRMIVLQASPIALAVVLQDETAVRQLLAIGASAGCCVAELASTPSAHSKMIAMFGNANSRWLKSAPPELGVPSRKVRSRISHAVHMRTCTDDAATESCAELHASPVLLAIALLASAANIATHTHGTTQPKLTGGAATCARIFTALVRAGGLQSDHVGPQEYNAIAIVLVTLRQWDLLQILIEELLKLRRNFPDGDRFFAPIESCCPLLRPWVRSDRHVIHSSVKCASREVLITVARHSLRADVEGCKDADGRTAMYHAIRSNSLVAFDTLSALQIPMNTICDTHRRRTPLMIAAKEKKLLIVTHLLKLKDVTNQRDGEGNTALMLAASRGVQEVVELLLSAQADASIANEGGLTALFLAALNGHDNISLPLCQHFTRTDGFASRNGTALHYAAVGGCRRTTDFLVRTYETLGVLQPDAAGHSPLYLAYCFGHDQVLRTLLAALQQRTEKPPTHIDDRLVMCSSTLKRYGWLRGVLSLADVLQRETRKKGAPKLLTVPGEQVLAPVTSRMRSEKSVLLWCAKTNNAVGVRVCADHNMMDDCCALHYAAKRGAIDVVQLLVTLDMSDPNAPNNDGKLALDLALEYNKENVALVLVQRMRINLSLLKPVSEKNLQNIFHRICASPCGAAVLPIVVTRLTNVSLTGAGIGKENAQGGNYDPAVLSVLEAVQRADSSGLTPFECAISVGSPALVLRVAQALQVLGTSAGQEVAVTLSSALLLSLPSLSPSIRVLLYDFFNVTEVASSVGFGRAAGQGSSTRASFADIRMIGINTLRKDQYCGPKLDAVFTVDHERGVLKHLTQLLDVPFRLRFKPEALRGLTPNEQVDVLQRIGTSSVLGKYTTIVAEKLFQIGSLELELGQSRSDVRVDVVGSTVTERFFVGSGRGACVIAPNAAIIIQKLVGSKIREAKLSVDKIVKTVVAEIRGLDHPLLQCFKAIVDWNGFVCPKAPSDSSVDSLTTASLRESQSQFVSEAACNVLLGHRGLGWIRRVFLEKLHDVLCSASSEELRLVAGSTNQQPPLVTFQYMKQTQRSDLKHTIVTEAGRYDITIEFSDDGIASIETAFSPLLRLAKRDAVLVNIHTMRDAFVQRVSKRVGQKYMNGDIIKFKLDVESASVEDIPPHMLEQLLFDTEDSLESLFRASSLALSSDDGKTRPLRRSELTSTNIVAQSVAGGLRAVFVLFSTRREPFAKRSGNRLMLCFTPLLAPTRSCVYNALVLDTAVMESDRLREKLPTLVDDMQQRLHTYLPSSTLIVDAPSLTQLGDDEKSCAALSLLFHNRSESILQALVQGIAVGWDTRLGAVVRKCVRQVTLVLETSSEATIALLPNGNLVYFCPLLCVQQRTRHSWSLLTAPQIASWMIIHLLELHPDAAQLIDTTRPFACWCAIQGKNSRYVTAGDSRCTFNVTTRNIINKKVASNAEEPLEFRGRLSSIRVTKKASASKKVINSTLRVCFASPTKAGVVPLHVMLHGHHLSGSPLVIRVHHAAAHIPSTSLLSSYNTVIQGVPFDVELQLRDQFQNVVRRTANSISIEGPPALNDDGISLQSWVQSRPGVIKVTVVTQRVTSRCTIPIRISANGLNLVVPFVVEVISPEIRKQLKNVKSTPVNRTSLYFRSSIRKAEIDRQRRDIRLLGGIKTRTFAEGQ